MIDLIIRSYARNVFECATPFSPVQQVWSASIIEGLMILRKPKKNQNTYTRKFEYWRNFGKILKSFFLKKKNLNNSYTCSGVSTIDFTITSVTITSASYGPVNQKSTRTDQFILIAVLMFSSLRILWLQNNIFSIGLSGADQNLKNFIYERFFEVVFISKDIFINFSRIFNGDLFLHEWFSWGFHENFLFIEIEWIYSLNDLIF